MYFASYQDLPCIIKNSNNNSKRFYMYVSNDPWHQLMFNQVILVKFGTLTNHIFPSNCFPSCFLWLSLHQLYGSHYCFFDKTSWHILTLFAFTFFLSKLHSKIVNSVPNITYSPNWDISVINSKDDKKLFLHKIYLTQWLEHCKFYVKQTKLHNNNQYLWKICKNSWNITFHISNNACDNYWQHAVIAYIRYLLQKRCYSLLTDSFLLWS